jgi:hypothetical protein
MLVLVVIGSSPGKIKQFKMATIEIFPGGDYTKTSIPRGHQAL